MWGGAYIATAIFAPQISGDSFLGTVFYMILGVATIASVLVHIFSKTMLGPLLLLVLAIIGIYGGVASWSGIAIWNVPFPNKELFQVSMAFGELITSVLMLYLTLFRE
jgi:hypothetical protein